MHLLLLSCVYALNVVGFLRHLRIVRIVFNNININNNNNNNDNKTTVMTRHQLRERKI